MKVIGEWMERKRGQVRERIFRVLLNHADEKLTKYRISKESEANIAWVIKTLRKLEKMGIVKSTEVRDYRKLIHHWRKLRTTPDKREYMVQNPLDLLKSAKLKYALTTYAAENLIQKYLFPSRIDFYIDPKDKVKWHNILSQEGLVGKGNTRVLIGDTHVFYNLSEKEGLKTVSVPQLVVDLLREGGPCAEAAEMLIEKEEEQLVHRK
ncbi:hypothetical protein SCCGRSA3_02018 [Marine Group I thaumarchaeote SCGC RSA3]|uniref:Uncharacterized protein n=2 Tax=Marine Group I TaxID=905826 RepID=A0A081RNU9_9ARCH|nr:hypothetical protein AAA799N04_00542 [Marine Group I thaumarchaeote SCGC AAA799-N04]KFM16983.1 hypothetical protein SCCGRSA3_02018 [Marine Group I thaumarchaeote SCGC RSA3]